MMVMPPENTAEPNVLVIVKIPEDILKSMLPEFVEEFRSAVFATVEQELMITSGRSIHAIVTIEGYKK